MPSQEQSDPSQLPGTHRKRVFIGGSYEQTEKRVLDDIVKTVEAAGFIPVLVIKYWTEDPDDIHNVTMFLLHACRLAIFDLSIASGALMEIERVPDYGTRALILYRAPSNREWMVSRMLSTFVTEHKQQIQVLPYTDMQVTLPKINDWLVKMGEEGFA